MGAHRGGRRIKCRRRLYYEGERMSEAAKTDVPPKETKPDGAAMLAADALTFSAGEYGRVKLSIREEPVRSYASVYALPIFPLTAPTTLIQLYAAKDDGAQGDMIGILEDIEKLDAAGIALIKRLIRSSRMLPVIKRIDNVLDEQHAFHWFVLTDRGTHDFFTGSARESIQHTTSGQLVIEDLAGNQYIMRKSDLDARSRELYEIAS